VLQPHSIDTHKVTAPKRTFNPTLNLFQVTFP